jgi:lysyl endopeptidase
MRAFAHHGRRARRLFGLATVAVTVGAGVLIPAPSAGAQVPGGSAPAIHHAPTWLLRTSLSSGPANLTFNYGVVGDIGVMGDWNGDGHDTVGVVRQTPGPGGSTVFTWFLRNSNSGGSATVTPFVFGTVRFVAVDQLGTIPVAGDWNGDGIDTPGVMLYSASPTGTIQWQLRNSNTAGPANITASYGNGRDVPVVGDWDGNRTDTLGLFRSNRTWLLRNSNTSGNAQITFAYGSATIPELAVPGDWDRNGTDTPAVLRNQPSSAAEGGYEIWLFRNANSGGAANGQIIYGSDAQAIDLPIETVPRFSWTP